ncbi:MFS transporter [Deinococcus sp.]|uniref:MFS transporter n=1 Tax=Deinococcus sp. TaxID=47478 RepID=UPI0025CCE352|nr:MFS transporter [Deinococcus sp.]
MTSALPALKHNFNFWLWWFASAQSALGSALAGVALSLLVYRLSGSAGALGVNLALSLLPGLLSPLLGTLIDRLPVRLPLVLGDALRGGFQLAAGALALRGQISVEALNVLAFLGGLVGAFYGPAGMGVLAGLVRPGDLARATGLMQSSNSTMNLLGLVGGGVLVGVFGSAGLLVADGASFLLMAGLLLLVRFAPRPVRVPASFWADFTGGLRYARSSTALALLPVLGFFINATLAPMEMLVLPRMKELGAGAAGYGLFFGMLVGGQILGSLAVVGLGPRLKPRALSVWAFAAAGMLLLTLALTRTAPQMYAVALLLGAALALVSSAISLLFIGLVAPAYFGRVGSLLNMVSTTGMPLTLLLLAPVADRVPIWTMFAASGAVTLMATAVWRWALSREPLEREGSPAT